MHLRSSLAERSALAAALVAAIVTYWFRFAHPWPHTPLNQFLAMFARNNAAVWPAQILWCGIGLAIVGLALRSGRRWSQVVCLLAAAYSAWIGIAYFAWLNPGMNFSWAFAALFVLQAVLLVIAGVARRDVVIGPRRDLASLLGAVFMAYAIVGYPVIGLLGGHALRTLPVFGLSPCSTVIFLFGLLLWARPPVPKYLLLVPLAWALTAAPPDLARGVAADYGMVVVGVITAAVVIWRDRTSTWPTVTAALLLALMITWSGHDNVLIILALVLMAAALVQGIISRRRPPRADPLYPPRMDQVKAAGIDQPCPVPGDGTLVTLAGRPPGGRSTQPRP